MRINKYLALHLNTSRRNADELIKAKKITVNNKLAVIGQDIMTTDVITYQNKILSSKIVYKYFKFYKPIGYICSSKSQGKSKTIYDIVNDISLKYSGRLDKDSEGLMLLSTDGDWLNNIFNAKNKITKKYIIKIKFPLPKGKKFKQNINHNGEVLKITNYKLINKYTYEVALKTGKNHEIRRIFRFNNLKITTLKRNRIGKYSLKDLSPGDLVKINIDE